MLTLLLTLRKLRLQSLKALNRIKAEDYNTEMDFLRKAIAVQLYSPPVDRKPKMQAVVEPDSKKA